MKNIFLYSFVSIVLYKLISTISAEMFTLQKAEKNATHESECKIKRVWEYYHCPILYYSIISFIWSSLSSFKTESKLNWVKIISNLYIIDIH